MIVIALICARLIMCIKLEKLFEIIIIIGSSYPTHAWPPYHKIALFDRNFREIRLAGNRHIYMQTDNYIYVYDI